MRYGNCLLGALALLWMERLRRPRFLLRRRPGTLVPHFMVVSEAGLHHYRVVEDILPWPLCYLLFRGRFQTVQPGDESDFEKSSCSRRPSPRGWF